MFLQYFHNLQFNHSHLLLEANVSFPDNGCYGHELKAAANKTQT